VVNAGPQETPQFDAVRRSSTPVRFTGQTLGVAQEKNSAVIMAIFAAKHKANVAQR